MMLEVDKIFVRILLMCATGEDISEMIIDYRSGGKIEKKSLPFVLRDNFGKSLDRINAPHVALMPYFANIYISSSERDLVSNCNTIREVFIDIVNKRRK